MPWICYSSYSPDTFGTYLSNPDRKVSGIDLSSASVLEVLNAYCAFRKTLNPSYSNDAIVRKVHKLEKEFSCTLMPMQITEAEVRKCSGHKSTKTFERYITFDDD